jgi:hypothetical protein
MFLQNFSINENYFNLAITCSANVAQFFENESIGILQTWIFANEANLDRFFSHGQSLDNQLPFRNVTFFVYD